MVTYSGSATVLSLDPIAIKDFSHNWAVEIRELGKERPPM